MCAHNVEMGPDVESKIFIIIPFIIPLFRLSFVSSNR